MKMASGAFAGIFARGLAHARTASYSFIRIRLLVQQLTKRNFAVELE